MSTERSAELGTEEIGRLLIKQAGPASIGFLVMSIYSIVDTIYVGHWVGPLAIAAISVVMPITFLIASIGMAIGVGGASIISRALGSEDREKANHAFGNQVSLILLLGGILITLGFIFQDQILLTFGAKGDILPHARVYFHVILYGIPFLAIAMMINNVLRAEGKPKVAMLLMVIPAIANIIMDPILIIYLKMGLEGAALATTISYILSASYGSYFFLRGKGELRPRKEQFMLSAPIVKEIFAIGGITLARQGSVSLLTVVLNHSLFKYGGELAVATYGIISRMMMFSFFPVMGVVQGFLPIAGYNYGAGNWLRVRSIIRTAIVYGTLMACLILILIIVFAPYIVKAFTDDPGLLSKAPSAMVFVFLASPLICLQLIGSAYFQAIGRARPALFLTLTKQGFFLIPLVLFIPTIAGLEGIWYSFPIADMLAALVTGIYLYNAVKDNPFEKSGY